MMDQTAWQNLNGGGRTQSESVAGVSILICCHNSARLIPRTLEHLQSQRVPAGLSWEVLLVDNASRDNTADVAREAWTSKVAPLRIVTEPRLGVSNARALGFDEARYDLVSWVDHDNWVAEDWVAQVARVMGEHPEAGACGGVSTAVCEAAPPPWFANYENYYAVGGTAPGGYSDVLWGAGMSVRRSIWQALQAQGFERLTTTAAEDVELSWVLRLSGWKLWVDPRLRFQHFISASRLNWGNFLKLQRERSACLVNLDSYKFALELNASDRGRLSEKWVYNFGVNLWSLLKNILLRPQKVFGRELSRFEGDEDVFRIEWYLGRLKGLFRNRRVYNSNVQIVTNAKWRCPADLRSKQFAPCSLIQD